MPARSYTLSIGQRREQTVEAVGSAVGGAPAVQVTIDYDANTRKHDVIATLDKIKLAIIQGRYPPA